ncbi:bifunctional acyl-ACP--phospholipid O-acyltransferase/long-chain-fatty-acid--ACP ligase [Nitrincola alkalisediminis]|uniref:bifunctional acyl-ACP--phospholipid O-acyltransferase/long-chain-fatty-acid--ACP ligase n=1 Tax=Nitrincola alkalisediminis TaxID=1366656 RepID=UPI0018739651|nr:bifunctional acyl-ACP--phospholipid O-acyltransferase/long-chain-fatty-acid--ACP ligase [Nitrincola alkalisediminis]
MIRRIIEHLLRTVFERLFKLTLHQQEGVDFSQPRLLIIANHQSFIDGMLLALYLPIKPVFVVHSDVSANPFFRFFLSKVEFVLVDPAHPMAMKTVIRLIESGRPVVIFPEGRITQTGSLMKIYEGPAFVAAKAQATLLPVCIDGASHTYFSRLSGKHPRQLFPKLSLTFLPTRPFTMPEGESAKLRRKRAGEALRRVMQEMIFTSCKPKTLFSSLCHASKLYGKRRKLVEDIKQIEYSYNDLLKMALMLGKKTEAFSSEHENIGVLLPNLAPTLGLIFGMTARQRVPALLNYTAGVEALQSACDVAKVTKIITSKAFIEQAKLEDKIAQLRGITFHYLEDIRASITLADKLWLVGWALHRPLSFEKPASTESTAVVLYTSGSEGKPKGVVLSHRAIMANINQIRAVTDFSVYDKVFNALPIFHSFGLTAGALLPVLSGMSLFLYPTPLHYRIIPELSYDRGCTILFGTSTFLNHYGKYAHPYDFHRLRYVVAGAEKLTDSVRNLWFDKFGLRVFEGYGTTETAPVLAVNTPMAYRYGSVGQFLPLIESRITPIEGIEQGGALHVRGPNVMSGYLKVDQPGILQPPTSSVGDGWYETGDIVEIDNDGYIAIIGRLKRFAKLAGEMISLEVAETLAYAVSPDKLHAVSSRPDTRKGEALVLFTTDPTLTKDQLLKHAQASGVSEIAVPREIQYVDTLPLLGTGKIDYVTLKTLAQRTLPIP